MGRGSHHGQDRCIVYAVPGRACLSVSLLGGLPGGFFGGLSGGFHDVRHRR